MIRSTLTLLVSLVMISFANAQTAGKLNIGDRIPGSDIQLKNATGGDATVISAMQQNGLLVMFSCNTCPFVIKNQSITKRAIEYATTHKIGVVILNSNEAKRDKDDSYAAMQTYAKEQGYSIPYLIDENSKLADMYGAGHTPEVFLFDNKGILVYKGGLSDNASQPEESKVFYLNNAMENQITHTPIQPNTTKSIGCSIKRKA